MYTNVKVVAIASRNYLYLYQIVMNSYGESGKSTGVPAIQVERCDANESCEYAIKYVCKCASSVYIIPYNVTEMVQEHSLVLVKKICK